MNIDNQLDVLDKEKLIAHLFEKLRHIEKNRKEKHPRYYREIKDLVVEGSVRSPAITYEFLNTLIKQFNLPEEECNLYLYILEELDRRQFIKYLLNKLMTKEGFVGHQEELFVTTLEHGKKLVERLFDTREDKKQIFDHIKKLAVKKDALITDIFSPNKIILKANEFFQLGVKYFCQENIEKAIEAFEISFKLYRNQILTCWNLARLYNLINRSDKAENYFAKCIKLTYIIKYKNPTLLRKLINMEKKGALKPKQPIISLSELLHDIQFSD